MEPSRKTMLNVIGTFILVSIACQPFSFASPTQSPGRDESTPVPPGLTQTSTLVNWTPSATQLPWTTTELFTPTLTPTPSSPTGKIVFACQISEDVGRNQICIIDPDGSNWRRLTSDDQANHGGASLSPDGQRVVFDSSMSGEYEIYEMDLAGNQTRLTTLGDSYAPAISPNGELIVFYRTVGDFRYLWLMNRDGSSPRQISGQGWNAWDPAWSPDSQEILFASDKAWVGHLDQVELYIMNLDGSDIRTVTQVYADYGGVKRIRGRSDWSPDGRTLASYVGQRWHWDIFLIDRDGENFRLITGDGGNYLAPSFSPSGQWIAFTSYRDKYGDEDGCEIYVMRMDGTEIRRLTDNEYCDWQPRWGP